MATLESSKLFRLLGATELSALRQIASERQFSAGQAIFKAGDNGDGVYVVKDGLVEISVAISEKERRVFAQVTPGEMFGEMAVLEYKPRSATATAARASVVYFIPRNELLLMVERSPLLALELLREISQRLREFNQRYIQEMLQAERLSVVGKFARSIVHDIKNPLNIIGLSAELSAMEQATVEMRKKSSVTIRKQVERISEMVNEILDFTQGSRSDVIMATLDYGTFAQQLLDELRPEMELKNAALLPEGIPSMMLPFDPQRLRRVFSNLIHNASDALPDGGKIFVRFITSKTEVVTEIEDTGAGIAPEIADRLFEVFATFGKAHGTGLGLSICKKIVEDHHGRIWLRKEAGRGAIFCFALPLAKRDGQT
ncbi:MAG: cyclic nucleotide-binding domain-containing protein [Akkermansiaceae bacterium]|nr:cyclic nucleotide-binding domain-containing protein [Verrucomicrobiales bacterium]